MNNSYILGEVPAHDILDSVGPASWKTIPYSKDGYSPRETMILFASWSFLETDRSNKLLSGLRSIIQKLWIVFCFNLRFSYVCVRLLHHDLHIKWFRTLYQTFSSSYLFLDLITSAIYWVSKNEDWYNNRINRVWIFNLITITFRIRFFGLCLRL